MRVLAALGLDDEDELVLQIAARRAREGGSLLAARGEVGVCHVIPDQRPIRPLFPQQALSSVAAVSELAVQARAAVERRVRACPSAVDPVTYFIEEGEAYAEIVRRAESWKADLVVIGARRRAGLAAALLGGVADRVVRYASTPVLVARNLREHGHVVAATDLSDPSLPAIAAGYAESRLRGGGFTVLHVLPVREPTAAPYGLALPIAVPPAAGAETESLVAAHIRRELNDELGIRDPDVAIRVLSGPPAATIASVAAARDAELVVVGTRGRTGLSRIVLGSVAEEVVRTAPCSVLAVRLGPSHHAD